MTTLPEASITHDMKNRLRIRVRSMKGEPEFFQQVEEIFQDHPRVVTVETNPLTGSILLTHKTTTADLLDYAADNNLFTLPGSAADRRHVLEVVSETIERTDERIQSLAGGKTDLYEVLFIGLISAGVIQILRGHAFGHGTSLLAYAAGILTMYRERQRE